MDAIDWTRPPREQWSYASDEEGEEEEDEMSPIQKMPHQSNEGTRVGHELFSPQLTDGHGPLGLNLKKSPSALELIQKELAQAAKVKRNEDAEYIAYTRDLHTKATVIQGMKPSQKLKASNFQASLLRIGDWEWRSRYEGDLVAKLYFSKSKVAWEILQEGLKSKIEIKCSDICSLKVTCPKGIPGTLDITVSVEPQFFRETSPRPHRSTRWLATTDFTGGQANALRHVLQSDPGIMDKHIENLLSRDNHLYLLSQENTINPESPCLEPWCSMPEIPKSSSHQDLYHSDHINHYGASLGVLPTSVADTAVITEELSEGHDMFNWKKFFETTCVTQPFMSNGWIMNDTGNHINNQINSGSSRCGVDYSSSRMAMPEVMTRFPDNSTTNRQVESRNRPSQSDHGVLFPSSVPTSTSVVTEEPSRRRAQLKKDMFNWKSFLRTPHEMQPSVSNAVIMNNNTGNRINNQINPWIFNGSGTFLQNEPAGNPPGNDDTSSERTALEQIRWSLLSDDDEVADVADEERLMSTVNSLSCLLGPSQSSQANDTQVAPPSGGREGQ